MMIYIKMIEMIPLASLVITKGKAMRTNKYIAQVVNLVYDIVHDKELNYAQVMQTLLSCCNYFINAMFRIEKEGM